MVTKLKTYCGYLILLLLFEMFSCNSPKVFMTSLKGTMTANEGIFFRESLPTGIEKRGFFTHPK